MSNMKSVTPEIRAPKLVYGKDQPEYQPITAALVRDAMYSAKKVKLEGTDLPFLMNTVLYAFEPTPEQREAIANGADIYVALLTGGNSPQPVRVLAGSGEAANWFHTEVEHDHSRR
jgi:hypothetical protein